MNKINNAVKLAEEIAKDDSHGYDQVNRWGTDYDCSALIITCLENSGIKVKTAGATYTGNMYKVFIKLGFQDVTKQVNLSTGRGLKRGDVLLTPFKHTEFYCGKKKLVGARINEKGKATGGKKGDQTGKEICIHPYYNYPWKYVLRNPEASQLAKNDTNTNLEVAKDVIAGKYGNGELRKINIEKAGYNYSEIQALVNSLLRYK